MTTSRRRKKSAIGTATQRTTVKSRAANQALITEEANEVVSAHPTGMRIYFAGASGVIGSRLVPLLVHAGHTVRFCSPPLPPPSLPFLPPPLPSLVL